MATSPGRDQDWLKLRTLFVRHVSGDSTATREVFESVLKALQGFFHNRLGSNRAQDAEDLAQATLLKIHFARERFDATQSFKTWVFTIASRTLIDHWREAASDWEQVPERSGEPASSPSPNDPLDAIPSELLDPARKTELSHDLNQALARLKPTERSIVYLYGIEGLSMAEIGRALSLTEGAVKIRAHRAYQELRKWM